MGFSSEERIRINGTIRRDDLSKLRRELLYIEPKTWRSYYRKATRMSQKTHVIPFIRRATPDGSGKKAYGRKSIASAGLRQRGGTRLSAGTYKSRKSTGALRRDFKVKAMKRSRKITGNSTVNFKKTIFYGKLLEMGRTWNRFMKKREWDKVPANQKGPGSRNWIPGRQMWNTVSRRRKVIAEKATIREIWRRLKRDDDRIKKGLPRQG